LTPTRPDREGLELRNVVANYPFEKSRSLWRFSRILATQTIRGWAAALGIRSSGLGVRQISPSPAERHASSDTPAVRNQRPAVTFRWSSAACTAANISVKASEPAMSAPLTRLMKAPNVITDLPGVADSGLFVV
jgi:hypothetical protein